MRLGVYLNFRNSNGKYPFGIKHLYFLNANFNPNSYAVFKIQENKYIETISENVIITDQTGTVESSCTEENMELYIDWTNGIGIDSIATSKGLTINPVVRDTNTFYVYYPILRSTMAFQFESVTLR